MTNTPQTETFDIDALLAFHKANFGSARMEDETTDADKAAADKATADKADADKAAADKATADKADADKAAADKPDDDKELSPEVLRKELTRVRGEAANYRTKFREATEALGKAKTPEDFEAANAEFTEKIAALEGSILRSAIASKHDLPSDLADALKGTTEAELEAHAKVLAKYATGTGPADLSGGLTPNETDDGEMDPGALARQHGTRRRR